MRFFPCAFLAPAAVVLATAFSQGALAQTAQAVPAGIRVPGSTDAKTGVFVPDLSVAPDATVAPVAGTLTVTLHISIKSVIPAGDKVGCTASLSALQSSATGTTAYTESVSSYATVSGSTATCVLTIPHSWAFSAATTTTVQSLTGNYAAIIFNPTATTATAAIVSRESGSQFVALTGKSIFATAPTAFSVNVTL